MHQVDRRFRIAHRQIIAAVFAFNSLFTFIYIGCAFNSEMVFVNPPKYYKSLEEMIKFNKLYQTPVLIVKGLIVDRKLASQGNIWSQVAKEAQVIPLSGLTELPFQVATGSVLVSNAHIIYYVRSFLCSHAAHRHEYQYLRESPSLASESAFMLFSANVSTEIETRVSNLISLQFEAGIVRYDLHRIIKFNVAEIFAGSKLQIHRCEGRQSAMKWPSNAFNDITFDHSVRFICFFLSLMSIATIVFVAEILSAACFTKQLRKNPLRMGLQ